MFKMPDPRDCTVNKPAVLVEQEQVLDLFNAENEVPRRRVDERVKKFFIRKAQEAEWSKVEFHGNQCLLIANISLRQTKV